jgi:hypothetical protein
MKVSWITCLGSPFRIHWLDFESDASLGSQCVVSRLVSVGVTACSRVKHTSAHVGTRILDPDDEEDGTSVATPLLQLVCLIHLQS